MLIVGAGLAFSAIAVFLTWSALRKGRARVAGAAK
jgi:hypothetical protein